MWIMRYGSGSGSRGGVLREQGEYWKTRLEGAPALLELPTDHGRPAQQDYAGGFASLVLDESLTADLKKIGKRHGTTLYMTLLAGWAALMARLSGQQDVVIGTPVANRSRVEIEGLIGCFVNTLALRVDVSGSPVVGELLKRVRVETLAAQEQQDIPFEQVVEIVRPVRSLSQSPVFQAMFTWQNAPEGTLEIPGVAVQSLLRVPLWRRSLILALAAGSGGKDRGWSGVRHNAVRAEDDRAVYGILPQIVGRDGGR